MRLALVANPKSGTAPPPERLAELLGADGAQVGVTAIQDLASEDGGLDDAGLKARARALSKDGPPDRIVVAGGDGSIGLTALIAADMGVPLAVVAAGTANDFARSQGLSLDIEEACALARDPDAPTRHAELALAGDRPFVNAAATGLSVVAAKEARPHKSRLGPLAYARRGAQGRGDRQAAALQRVLRRQRLLGGPRLAGRRRGDRRVRRRQRDGRHGGRRRPARRRGRARRLARRARAPRLRHASRAAHRAVRRRPPSRARRSTSACEGRSPTFNVDGEVCPCEPAHFTLRPGGFRVVAR